MLGEVLVAIMNNKPDFNIVVDKHWYRIPVRSANRFLKNRWPPTWLALYQTKAFGPEKYAVNYYARVLDIHQVYRRQLFPNQPHDERSEDRYYQLWLGPLQRLPRPIPSRRLRRIVFIPTTFRAFKSAGEINDLYDASPLENALWSVFKRHQISAERQWYETVKGHNYFLDFAIHCAKGKVDVETDGDTWHANPEKAVQDNIRDNDLSTVGWQILRFSTVQIREHLEDYCLSTVIQNINGLGGIENGKIVPRKIDLRADGSYQPRLCDDL